MATVRHFKRAELVFEHFGGPPGDAKVARLLGPDLSRTMGVGVCTFDGCSIGWTVLYDEVIVVLEGLFRLRVADEVILGQPGDVVWIPAKTPIFYEGDRAVVCYVLYPVDWRQRHGIA